MSNDSRRDGSDSVCSGEPYNQLQDSVDAVYSLLKKVLMIRETEGSRVQTFPRLDLQRPCDVVRNHRPCTPISRLDREKLLRPIHEVKSA